MKFLIVLFALIVAAFAAPQFVPIQPLGFSGSSSNAAASSQSFNQGGFPGGFGYPGFGGQGFSGSSANAAAGSQTFSAGK